MAKCDYCGKELSENTIFEAGANVFCNIICRNSFENNGNMPKQDALSNIIEAEKHSLNSKKTTATIVAIVTALVAAFAGQLKNDMIGRDFSNFKEFSSPDSSFTVMLPKDVKEQKQTANSQLGPMGLLSYIARVKHHEFSITYTDYPDSFITTADSKEFLDDAVEDAVRIVQGTLLSEGIVNLNGHPGREMRIEGPQKIIVESKIYLVGNRLYQIMAISEPGHSFDKEVYKMFSSFKIKGL
ncbi:MAG TPA: hypothetical protein VHP36_10480 [Chitinispirillaceae bacterium]|nr:hypothetical protein [Chitinispirillaceae bacterium]